MVFPAVWAMSALLLMMAIIAVYFTIFYMMFAVIGWGIIQVLRPIWKIINYGNSHTL